MSDRSKVVSALCQFCDNVSRERRAARLARMGLSGSIKVSDVAHRRDCVEAADQGFCSGHCSRTCGVAYIVEET